MIPPVQPGRPIDLRASDWNQMAAAANRVLGGLNVPGPAAFTGQQLYIKNTTADDLTRGQILGIDGVLYTQADREAEFLNRPTLKGVKPQAPTHIGQFALTLEPIAAGAFGRCAVDGIYPCPLTMNYSGHLYADIAHNSYALNSNWCGAAEILWRQASSGSTFGIVRLGNFHAVTLRGTASGDITAGSSGTVTVLDTGQTLTAYLDHADGGQKITSGKELFVTYLRYGQRWQITGAECE